MKVKLKNPKEIDFNKTGKSNEQAENKPCTIHGVVCCAECKETQNNELSTDKTLHIADVGGSIFFNVPIIAYEKTRLKLSKEEFEEFKTKSFTSDRAFFIWNKLPKDTRPELEFFMEWFHDDVHF